MIIAGLVAGIFLLLANVALFYIAKRQFYAGLRSFFAPRGENQSEFAELIGVITDQAAAKNAQSLKSVFMGQNSVASKNAARIDTAIATDVATQQAPLLGMGMSMFPNLQKLVTKNPGALQMLASLMAGQGSGNNNLEPGNNAGSGPDLFKL